MKRIFGVDQKPAANRAGASGTTYCQNFLNTGIPHIALDEPLTINGRTPAADEANSLFTFLAMRAMQSYTNLTCQTLLNTPNPITTTVDGNGVVIGASITVNGVTTTGGTVTPTATPTTTNGGVQQIATGTVAPRRPSSRNLQIQDGNGQNNANTVINGLQNLQHHASPLRN